MGHLKLFYNDESNKIGYKDETGNVVINPMYDDGQNEFTESETTNLPFAIVKKDGKYGIINNYNNTILPIIYDEVYFLFGDLFSVRKKVSDDEWVCGVINIENKEIIPFIYKFITEDWNYIKCYREATSSKIYGKLGSDTTRRYEYDDCKEEVWYNQNGKKIHEGNGRIVRDDEFLIIQKGKWGLIDSNGNVIIKFLYDDVRYYDANTILIEKDKKVGITNIKNELIIPPSYKEIQCVDLQRERKNKNERFFYDTDEKNSEYFKVHSLYKNWKDIINLSCHSFDISKPMVLIASDYSEFFVFPKGVIENSRYDQIEPLTELSYIVRKGKLFGIYRIDIQREIIPCEYNRIQYGCKHTVLLCKNGLWGAKTLAQKEISDHTAFHVDIPIIYNEIKIIDENERIFGVKCLDDKANTYSVNKNVNSEMGQKENSCYKIIDPLGNSYCDKLFLNGFESMFTYYTDDRILTKKYGKYGFISSSGYISIPFKYDEISERKDGNFNVRIDRAWGVLTLEGKEIVPIKYLDVIPNCYASAIVIDAFSGCYGILDKDGRERIPTIFQNLYYWGHYVIYDNWVEWDWNHNHCNYGCMNLNGKILTPPKYNYFRSPEIIDNYECNEEHDHEKSESKFILAGRDGYEMDNYDCGPDDWDKYTGIYDLYSSDGTLIIGGVKKFIYDERLDIYILQFGIRNEQGGLWLFLNKELKTIMRSKNGRRLQFKEGFQCIINIKADGNKNHKTINIPLEFLVKSFVNVDVYNLNIIVSDSDIDDDSYRQFAAIDIVSGARTSYYNKIKAIDKNTMFVLSDYVGMISFEKVVVPIEFSFFTDPEMGYYFAGKELDNEYSSVSLFSINDVKFKITAISKISTRDLWNALRKGFLTISFEYPKTNLENMIVGETSIFDESFANIISKRTKKRYNIAFPHSYWFPGDNTFLEDADDKKYFDTGYDDNYYDDERQSWLEIRRETWDAMTDGMYGDMPDDWNGTFDFMGH